MERPTLRISRAMVEVLGERIAAKLAGARDTVAATCQLVICFMCRRPYDPTKGGMTFDSAPDLDRPDQTQHHICSRECWGDAVAARVLDYGDEPIEAVK